MRYPWELSGREFRIVLCCVLCNFMIMFNIVMVATNLGTIQRAYEADISDVSVFSQIGAVSFVIFFLFVIAFMDRFGKKTSIQLGLLLIAATSLLCAYSWHIIDLTLFRFIGGLGVTLVEISAISVITDIVKSKYLPIAMSLSFVASSTGAIISPIIGMKIVDLYSIEAVFFFTAPVALTIMVLLYDMDNVKSKPNSKIDWPMHLTYIVSTLLIFNALLYVDNDSRNMIALAGILILVLFVFLYLRSKNKVIDGRIFKNKAFMSSIVLAFIFSLCIYGTENNINQFYQMLDANFVVFGILVPTVAFAASMVTLRPLIQMIASPILTRHFSEKEPSKPILISFALVTVTVVFAILTFAAGKAEITVLLVVSIYVIHAIASSIFIPFNKCATMLSVDQEDRNMASAVNSVATTLSGIVGVIILVNMRGGCDTLATYCNASFVLFVIVLIISIVALAFVYKKTKNSVSE